MHRGAGRHTDAAPAPGRWARARALAARTPASRNRCVDFLRAASILVVVLGHWLMAMPWVDDEGAHLTSLLAAAPWSQWLSWGLQVMPVFFIVGGYANGVSWDAACRDGRPYRAWIGERLRRLLQPVLILLLAWVVIAIVAKAAGMAPEMLTAGSQLALVPTWFLAVYAMVVLLVPLTRLAWRRFGMATFWAPVVIASVLDGVYFGLDVTAPGWSNYLFVWGAVHQLGYAWLDGRFTSRARCALWCLGGLAALALLTHLGPWPRSLVGIPGVMPSNTTPPHIPLLALAAFQLGGLLLAQRGLAALLENLTLWTATVLVNGMIMTLFLWHSTVMVLLFGLAICLDGLGLRVQPGSSDWWFLRLPWMAVFTVALLPVVAVLQRFESADAHAIHSPAVWRSVAGAALIVAGLAQLALRGVGGDGVLGLNLMPLLLVAVGGLLAGLGARASAAAPSRDR